MCTKNRQPLVIRNKLTCKLDKQPKRGLEELIDSRMMFGGTGPRVEVSGVETVSWQTVPVVSSYTLAQHKTHNIQLSSLSYAQCTLLFLPSFMHCKSYSWLINKVYAQSVKWISSYNLDLFKDVHSKEFLWSTGFDIKTRLCKV